MPHFLCKLKPPRPTFLADMSADEALVMRAASRILDAAGRDRRGDRDGAGRRSGRRLRRRDHRGALAQRRSRRCWRPIPAILSKRGFSYENLSHAGDRGAAEPAARADHFRNTLMKKGASRRE